MVTIWSQTRDHEPVFSGQDSTLGCRKRRQKGTQRTEGYAATVAFVNPSYGTTQSTKGFGDTLAADAAKMAPDSTVPAESGQDRPQKVAYPAAFFFFALLRGSIQNPFPPLGG